MSATATAETIGSKDRPVLVIGAGPAGLTAALSLAEQGTAPLVVEADSIVGGISKTLEHAGNRMDLGGHRFFSRSSRVMDFWTSMLPLQGAPACDDLEQARYVPLSRLEGAPDPERADRVMLSRSRLSRIYFLRRFFDYPVTLSAATIRHLGLMRTMRIGLSYLAACTGPSRQEDSLEDFMINRFGRVLYELFFRDYTAKVWGVPCDQIPASWGAQRIKGLSVMRAVQHAVKRLVKRHSESIEQKDTETSLIGRFLYPKLGPGQLWESVAERAVEEGCSILMRTEVVGVRIAGGRIDSVTLEDRASARRWEQPVAAVLSSMPIADLVGRANAEAVPPDVLRVARELPYRDFITCGLLLRRLDIASSDGSPLKDNWIYIQESEVRMGRVQVFNNWSPYLVQDRSLVWIGLEYFANEGDELWTMTDEEFERFAVEEASRIGLLSPEDVLDFVVHRVPKAYPAYFGTYNEFDRVRAWLDRIENLYVMGRNGMHRYNNMDHSMLSAWAAVEALLGRAGKPAVWNVNAEDVYHESAAETAA